jgi:hypothetical protein
MSILDDAIREHLELKRAHGADDVELKKLEDEAFGPPQRPDDPMDPFAEAPTEFLTAPAMGADEAEEEAQGRRAPNIADLQEAPELPQSPPEPAEALQAEEPEPPAEEEQPAMEHQTIPDPGHSTEERHAIADQPTEIFDVEGQFEDAATEPDAPSDDELVDAEMAEPRLAPVDPLAGIDGGAAEVEIAGAPEAAAEEPVESTDEFDEFFSEQRLSDELNKALEAPLDDEPTFPPSEEAAAVVEVEEEEEPAEPDPDVEVEGDHDEEDEFEEDSGELEVADQAPRQDSKEDLLEDTPEFLEDAPEDDELWFEQEPPKDIDFGD